MSILKRMCLASNAAVSALRDPSRTDMIAILGETTGLSALKTMRDNMLLDKTGRRILRERPLITDEFYSKKQLHLMPENSFGFQYHKFMSKYGFQPSNRSPIQHIDDEELAYVMLRYRQIHDFWHILAGFPEITVQSEIALKWFELMQTGLPMTLLSAVFGPVRLSEKERDEFLQMLPIAIQSGINAPFLMNLMYEDLLEQDISKLRSALNINAFES